jgi:hypothetical protein
VTQRHVTEELNPKLVFCLTENTSSRLRILLILFKEIITVRFENPTKEILWTKRGMFLLLRQAVLKSEKRALLCPLREANTGVYVTHAV